MRTVGERHGRGDRPASRHDRAGADQDIVVIESDDIAGDAASGDCRSGCVGDVVARGAAIAGRGQHRHPWRDGEDGVDGQAECRGGRGGSAGIALGRGQVVQAVSQCCRRGDRPSASHGDDGGADRGGAGAIIEVDDVTRRAGADDRRHGQVGDVVARGPAVAGEGQARAGRRNRSDRQRGAAGADVVGGVGHIIGEGRTRAGLPRRGGEQQPGELCGGQLLSGGHRRGAVGQGHGAVGRQRADGDDELCRGVVRIGRCCDAHGIARSVLQHRHGSGRGCDGIARGWSDGQGGAASAGIAGRVGDRIGEGRAGGERARCRLEQQSTELPAGQHSADADRRDAVGERHHAIARQGGRGDGELGGRLGRIGGWRDADGRGRGVLRHCQAGGVHGRRRGVDLQDTGRIGRCTCEDGGNAAGALDRGAVQDHAGDREVGGVVAGRDQVAEDKVRAGRGCRLVGCGAAVAERQGGRAAGNGDRSTHRQREGHGLAGAELGCTRRCDDRRHRDGRRRRAPGGVRQRERGYDERAVVAGATRHRQRVGSGDVVAVQGAGAVLVIEFAEENGKLAGIDIVFYERGAGSIVGIQRRYECGIGAVYMIADIIEKIIIDDRSEIQRSDGCHELRRDVARIETIDPGRGGQRVELVRVDDEVSCG